MQVAYKHPYEPAPDWTELFAEELTRAVSESIVIASGREPGGRKRVWDSALAWFVSSFPLLGAIAAYALAHDVPAARVVYCDAAAYDAGYLPVEQIGGRLRVRGRGGTRLQPGIDLLLRAPDFPAEAPLLVITDGFCEPLTIRAREHAYLLPKGGKLPFSPRGEDFTVR